MKLPKTLILTLIPVLMLQGCASTNSTSKNLQAHGSYLASKIQAKAVLSSDSETQSNQNQTTQTEQGNFTYLPSLKSPSLNKQQSIDLNLLFSESELVKLSIDALPLKDFLHYVFGEVLAVSYILGENAESDQQSLTLNLQQEVSKRKLYSLSEALLKERNYVVRYNDGIYYVHKAEGTSGKADIAYGYGNQVSDVPDTSLNIIQIVPYDFGAQHELTGVINRVLNVQAMPDGKRTGITIEGKRADIIKALEFIELMDQPNLKNRQIGVYKTTYVSTTDVIEKLPLLLKQEGLEASGDNRTDQALAIVPIERSGTLIFFANSQLTLQRAHFWSAQIDQPSQGSELQYHLYQPQFSRATDLGESLQVLIGGSRGPSSSASASTSAVNQNQQIKKDSSINVASNGELKLVIDERSNTLIFESSGEKFRQLLPIIKRLDVMPKQVMLEVMIAEVKLTDEFKQGVEFNLTNQGAAKVGGYNLTNASSGLSYILTGTYGKLDISLFQKNSNVEVLSRPSLVVRDGVAATITVGDDIPTVGEIITDPVNGSKSSVVYRKTGVSLSVTPTINAQGVVIMEISQKISNQAPGGDSVAGSPIIFERSIDTEVVAESGQTVILGGLISEDRTVNETGVPFFSSIPIFGRLFDGSGDTKNKTELVVMVTPKVIESSEEWQAIKATLALEFKSITIQ